MTTLQLRSDALEARIDPGYGGEMIAASWHGQDLLFRTPWADRAARIRNGHERATSHDPVAGWIERYQGGWQAMCPNPGAARRLNDADLGFHASSTIATWSVEGVGPSAATLATELFDIPLRIDRHIALAGETITWTDRLTNHGEATVRLDYASHPGFGGGLLGDGARIETDAQRVVLVDADAALGTAEGAVLDLAKSGHDLLDVDGPDRRTRRFGWFEGFVAGRARIIGGGLAAVLTWDAAVLPYAWLWQECGATAGFPWFGRGRVIAIEPSSTTPTGAREPGLRLEAGADLTIAVQLKMETDR